MQRMCLTIAMPDRLMRVGGSGQVVPKRCGGWKGWHLAHGNAAGCGLARALE